MGGKSAALCPSDQQVRAFRRIGSCSRRNIATYVVVLFLVCGMSLSWSTADGVPEQVSNALFPRRFAG
jgi:hypothetical protein